MCEKKTNPSEQKQKQESRLQSRGIVIVQTASFLYQRGESSKLEIVFYK